MFGCGEISVGTEKVHVTVDPNRNFHPRKKNNQSEFDAGTCYLHQNNMFPFDSHGHTSIIHGNMSRCT